MKLEEIKNAQDIDPRENCPYCGSTNIEDHEASWITQLHFPDAPDMYFCKDCKDYWEVSVDENV